MGEWATLGSRGRIIVRTLRQGEGGPVPVRMISVALRKAGVSSTRDNPTRAGILEASKALEERGFGRIVRWFGRGYSIISLDGVKIR